MVFSSLTFLYIFLPLVLIANYLVRKEFRNALLLIASIIFYAWGGVSYTAILIISILLNFVIGKLIAKNLSNIKSRRYLIIGVIVNLGFLGVFKYANFIIENINSLIETSGISFSITEPGIYPLALVFTHFKHYRILLMFTNEKHLFKISLLI